MICFLCLAQKYFLDADDGNESNEGDEDDANDELLALRSANL